MLCSMAERALWGKAVRNVGFGGIASGHTAAIKAELQEEFCSLTPGVYPLPPLHSVLAPVKGCDQGFGVYSNIFPIITDVLVRRLVF